VTDASDHRAVVATYRLSPPTADLHR
jgi:hypothetical protein